MTDENDKTPMTNTPINDDAVNIFDRNVIRLHRDRAAKITASKDYGDANFLFLETADRLVDRLMDIQRSFDVGLDLGCHSGEIQHWLTHTSETENTAPKVKHLLHMDMSESYAKISATRTGEASFVAEEDFLPVKPSSLDLVVSNLSMHWINDLPGAFAQIRQALKPDGLFLSTMMGGDSLLEMRSALMEAEIELTGGVSPRVSPFADIKDAGRLMQNAGFTLPVLDTEIITVTYDNIFKLAADLRNMGETNSVHARVKNISSRRLFMRAAEIYAEHHQQEDGRIPASFVLLHMHGWAPDPSQQQPAKPGSGQESLADFFINNDGKVSAPKGSD